MQVRKASRPVSAATENEARKNDRLAGAIISTAKPDRLIFQAAHLTHTFGLTETHATLIAALAFGEVRS